jgi:dihydrofolate synthase/folylpolyglutamate synthase
MFTQYKEAITWIESVKKFGDKLDLSRMKIACTKLQNPEQKLNVIHIAGTNGKGSTVSYLKHVLLAQGYNVGTFTSPYIVRFNERITYNNNDITNEDLLHYINKVKILHDEVLEEHNQVITFFELITLISFLYFSDHHCDFVIYEVGLGGKLDATNVVTPLISAITSISFDHMGVLGNTLESIALNKLGIVKEGIPLVTTINQLELFPLFEEYCRSKNSRLTIIQHQDITNIHYGHPTTFMYLNEDFKISMLGVHQVSNAVLCIEILRNLQERHIVKLDRNHLLEGLLHTNWPGRLEQFGNVYLDGAHNIGGAKALKESLKVLFHGKKIKVLYATMADKEYYDVISELDPVVDEIVFTSFDYPRCEEALTAYNICSSSLTHSKKSYNNSALLAFHDLKDNLSEDDILLITGSLYFVSYMRKEL